MRHKAEIQNLGRYTHCWSTLPLPLSAGQNNTRELTPSKRIQHNYIQTYHLRYKRFRSIREHPEHDWHQNAKRRHDSGRIVNNQYSIFNIQYKNNNNKAMTVISVHNRIQDNIIQFTNMPNNNDLPNQPHCTTSNISGNTPLPSP